MDFSPPRIGLRSINAGPFRRAGAPRPQSLPPALNLRQSSAPEFPDFVQRHARLRATSGGLLRCPILLQVRFRRFVRVVTCFAGCVVCPFPKILWHLLNSTYQNRPSCHSYSRGKLPAKLLMRPSGRTAVASVMTSLTAVTQRDSARPGFQTAYSVRIPPAYPSVSSDRSKCCFRSSSKSS